MSDVHKPLTARKLLTKSPRNECGRSSIDVHKLSFIGLSARQRGVYETGTIQFGHLGSARAGLPLKLVLPDAR